MEYTINTESLLPVILEEISRSAASAYDENGGSLYDAIVATSRDNNTIERHINDAVMTMVSRFSEIATLGGGKITFHIPDSRTHNSTTISSAADRYIILYVCTAWMVEKYKVKAEEYATRATDAMTKLERLLYEKLPPVKPEHIYN